MQFLKDAGQLAGIAGISVVAFLLIAKAMLQRINWPAPNKAQASTLLNRMLIFAFILAIAGMLSFLASKIIGSGQEVVDKGGVIDLQVSWGGSSTSAFHAEGASSDEGRAQFLIVDWNSEIGRRLRSGRRASEDDLVIPFLKEQGQATEGNEFFLRKLLAKKAMNAEQFLSGRYILAVDTTGDTSQRFYRFIATQKGDQLLQQENDGKMAETKKGLGL